MILLGLLLLVIFLMHEAGKPERWEWMGFDKQTKSANESVSSRSVDTPNDTLDDDVEPETTIQIGTTDSQKKSGVNSEVGDTKIDWSDRPSDLSIPASSQTADYPVAAVRFWHKTIGELSIDRRSQLLFLLKAIRTGNELKSQNNKDNQRLVNYISQLRDNYHHDLFDALTLATDGSENKKQLSSQLQETTAIWDQKVKPALDSAARGQDFTLAQQFAVKRLQLALDPVVFQFVQDKTSLGWAGDSLPWIRLWERLLTEPFPVSQRVSRIQLIGQPDHFRGNAISTSGTVLTARKVQPGENSEIGINRYFELWLRPADSNLGPINAYVHRLPEEFPSVTDKYSDLNVEVTLEGYFFKIRSYVAADKSVEHCPVVIAKSVSIVPVTETLTTSRWQPNSSVLTASFAVIPVIAIGIAWFAYRITQTRRFQPGQTSARKIADNLDALRQDPTIQSDLEKVMSLYDREPDDEHES